MFSAKRSGISASQSRVPLNSLLGPSGLVDESDDRHAAQAADFEQLARLRFDALSRVDHHDRRIDRRQRAIGVFGKILVPRRVEQVEGDPLALERHDRTGYRNAALLFDLHPVGPRPPRLPARLDLAGKMDGAAGQQQLLGQRGLARVGVGNDGESTAIGSHDMSLLWSSPRRRGSRVGQAWRSTGFPPSRDRRAR